MADPLSIAASVTGLLARTSSHDHPSSASHLRVLSISDNTGLVVPGVINTRQSQDFERTLKTTRVYRRAQSDQCDISFTSSAGRTHAWSALSDLSLSDISAISVIALPVSLEDINNIGPNLTFAGLLSPSGGQGSPETEEDVISRSTSRGKPGVNEVIQPAVPPTFHMPHNNRGTGVSQTTPDRWRYYPENALEVAHVASATMNSMVQTDQHEAMATEEETGPWIPQAMPDGNLFYFDQPTEETAAEIVLGTAICENERILRYEKFKLQRMKDQGIQPTVGKAKKSGSFMASANMRSPITHRRPGQIPEHKLVVLGSSSSQSVNTTALVAQFLQSPYDEYDPTFEDSYRKGCQIDGVNCILDVVVPEQYQLIRDSYLREGQGFVIFYSITQYGSLYAALSLYDEIARVEWETNGYTVSKSLGLAKPLTMLVGIDGDIESERQVSTQEAVDLAKRLGCRSIETCKKNNSDVENVFYEVVRMIRQWEKEFQSQ